jgi:hypothetical protein
MMNVAERAWKKFNEYEIKGLTVAQYADRIVFEQKDPTVKYDRVWNIIVPTGLMFVVLIFVGIVLYHFGRGYPLLVSFAPAVLILGLPKLVQHVFIPTQSLEITKGRVTFTRGAYVHPIAVEDIRSIDVTQARFSMPDEAPDEYGLVRIWDGPFAIHTLIVEGFPTGIALREGVKAAIEIMNPVASANPSPALPGRRREFAE